MTGDPAASVRLGPGAEFDLIRRFLSGGGDEPLPPDVLLGPGDDCAVLRGGIALSTDMVVEGVHFRAEWLTDAEVGWRAAAAALSDLAAVGARPIGVLASMALPAGAAGERAVAIAGGIREAAASVGAVVLGGDVTATPGPLVVDVVVVGRTSAPVTRAGAGSGEALWVTGPLGGAAAAVRAWEAGGTPGPAARAAFARPRPRTAEALWLAERARPSAMIDLSDGLAGDAAHLAAAGGVAVVLEAAAIPVHAAAADEADGLELALGGGEDYELCFAAPPDAIEPHLEAYRAAFGSALVRVGMVRAGDGVYLRDPQGVEAPLAVRGYRHFDGEVG